MSYPIGNLSIKDRHIRNPDEPDEPGGIDLVPFMENALESVVETIMLFGEYPQPRRGDYRPFRPIAPGKEFDLWDWLAENINSDDRNEFMFSVTVDYQSHSTVLSDWRGKIEKRLLLELADSDTVREKALQFAAEA